MTIRHLRTFVIVFQNGSITKASDILHVSQPSVTLAIQELEHYYHLRLFDRIGKRLSVTEQGRWLYDYAVHIVSMFDEMEKEVQSWNNKGTLRIWFEYYDWKFYSAAIDFGISNEIQRSGIEGICM